ncbi:MAG: ankyrin repeat domain-containing protein [Acidobacteria bacterium]|nr:ankyrin repeat domain-containing protein [Acidobacteriota bacterium]
MSNDSPPVLRSLPDRPNLRHLKDQAKDLLKAGGARSISDAQYKIARVYGFASWPKLKAHVESLQKIGQLKLAIDSNDLARVQSMMTRNPELHRAPMGYGKDGPLTWVAECRIPWEPPSSTRLAIAQWMIDNGSDVHQGGDGPLMRAALNRDRIAMMELLVANGADVNAKWHGWFPIIFAACEALDPVALQWLLEHGADPNCNGGLETALDYVLGTYARSPRRLSACIDILLNAGGRTKHNIPAMLEMLRGRLDNFASLLDADSALVQRQFPEFDFGSSGGRRLTLKGATLLHVAAEYGIPDAVEILLDRGADVNARASIGVDGIGGQTAIFHAATQHDDAGLPVVKLLIERGTDLTIRVKVPGHYERLDEIVECTPLEYAQRFPGTESETVRLLRQRG